MSNADTRPDGKGPDEAQWRAVREALEKFTGVGRWSVHGGYRALPPFEIIWDDPAMPAHAAGVTATFANGSIGVFLRSDLTPERIHRTMLHELCHVRDHRLLNIVSHAVLDLQAAATAAAMARW